MEMQHIVMSQLRRVVQEFTPYTMPSDVQHEMLLSDFQLDSLAFTSLLARLEQQLGVVPMGILRGTDFPQTIGELVTAYESEMVSSS